MRLKASVVCKAMMVTSPSESFLDVISVEGCFGMIASLRFGIGIGFRIGIGIGIGIGFVFVFVFVGEFNERTETSLSARVNESE